MYTHIILTKGTICVPDPMLFVSRAENYVFHGVKKTNKQYYCIRLPNLKAAVMFVVPQHVNKGLRQQWALLTKTTATTID